MPTDTVRRMQEGTVVDAPIGNQAAPVAIDLFCGAGGLSNGLMRAGFNVVLGLDFDRHALKTFAANHPGAKAVEADIQEVTGADLLRQAGVSRVDLLAGGPSCQGFSTHGKRLEDDPRNFLYKEFLRIVEELQPATVIMENVKGLIISGKGKFKREVVESFESLGYKVDGHVVRAVDYGVPQRRERVIFMASRLGESIDFPAPTHGPHDSLAVKAGQLKPYVTVQEAIGDLPKIGTESYVEPLPLDEQSESDYQSTLRDGSGQVWNHVAKPVSELAMSVISQVAPGQGLRSVPVDKLPERFHKMRRIANGQLRRDCTTLYYRLSLDEPAYTITCNFKNVSSGAFTHPLENRAITAREAARLQSFPDSFIFLGSGIPRQIGNAVPPLLGERMGSAIRKHLEVAAKAAAA